jgi:hypothetical protein
MFVGAALVMDPDPVKVGVLGPWVVPFQVVGNDPIPLVAQKTEK